jgi:signal transduction histidine kinase
MKNESNRIASFRRNDDLKTIFLSNISHELRTPLNATHEFNGFYLEEVKMKPSK